MILTDYYQMRKLSNQRNKIRFDCNMSTKSYSEFEAMRNWQGKLVLYFKYILGHIRRKPDRSITRSKNINIVCISDIGQRIEIGIVQGTKDALLLIYNDGCTQVDIFVAKGQRNSTVELYDLFADGELTDKINELKRQAIKDYEIK